MSCEQIRRRHLALACPPGGWPGRAILHAAFPLDHQDPGRGRGVCDVLVPGVSVADAPGGEPLDALLALLPVVHVDCAV